MVLEIEDYAIGLLDKDGIITNWNIGGEKIKGYTTDEIVGKHFSVFFTKEARDAGIPEQNLASALKDGRVENEGWRVKKDGSTFWATVTLTAIHDAAGLVIGLTKVTRDLTERRNAEMELKRQAELFDLMPDAVVYGTKMAITSMNKMAEELFEISEAEAIGRNMTDIVTAGNSAPPDDARELIWGEKGFWKGEIDFTTRSGRKVSTLTSVKRIDSDGINSDKWLGINTDITSLKETRQRLEYALDSMVAGLWEWNFSKPEQSWLSPRFQEMIGYSNNELIISEELYALLLAPEDLETVVTFFRQKASETSTFESQVRFRTKSGTYRWFSIAGKTKLDAEGKPSSIIGSIIDIDEDKKAQEVIEMQASLIQMMPDGIIYADINNTIISMNRGAENMFEIRADEAIGRNIKDLIPYTVIGSTKEADRREYQEHGYLRHEIEMTSPTGKKITALATIKKYDKIRGNEPGWVSIYTDISALRLNEELKAANSYLEQLAFITAHDVKSPILALSGLTDIIADSAQLRPEDREVLKLQKDVIRQMQRTNTGLNEILKLRNGLLSKDIQNTEPLRLDTIIDSVSSMVRRDLDKADALLEVSLHDMADIQFSFFYLQSVFHNLISNSIKYRDPQRPLIIRFDARKGDEDTFIFTISDNGLGFDMARQRDKLFGIFKRFHENIEGTGVGLHIVKSIIDAYGGEISAESEEGVGTTFEIRLKIPIAESTLSG